MTDRSPIIALLTDFGLQDTYVGVMKGVILGLCPTAQLIDLTHAIRPQDIRQGALALLDSYRYFPPGTVFLVVVDPGVGSARRPMAAQAGGYYFVGPDNGVLSYALREISAGQAVELTESRYRLAQTSITFHGRDIFAPAAAYLANGVSPGELGAAISDLVRLPAPKLEISDRHIVGEVIDIDHYGTLVTSIGTLSREGDFVMLTPRFDSTPSRFAFSTSTSVRVGRETVLGLGRAFSDVEPGMWVALIGSRGFLEIAVNRGSAAQRLGLSIGDTIELFISHPSP